MNTRQNYFANNLLINKPKESNKDESEIPATNSTQSNLQTQTQSTNDSMENNDSSELSVRKMCT